MRRDPKGANIITRKAATHSFDCIIPIRAIRAKKHIITHQMMVHLNNSIAYRCITFSCSYPVSVVFKSFLAVASASDVFLLLSIFVSLWIVTHSLAGHPQFGHAFNVSSLNNCPHSVHFTCAIIMNSTPQTQQCRLIVIG